MNTERSRQIQALFDAAVQLAPPERDAFLSQVSVDDTEVRNQVEELLAHHAQVERAGFLKAPSLLTDPYTASPGEPSGAALEREIPAGYELIGELGRGGMGVVYKAIQTNLKRPVALKMVLAGAHAGPEMLTRFRREAEAVARLKHTNIVHIYDFGDHQGLPWFAMEFVEGGSLAQKLAGKPQPVRESAQLVETLARAMHHAHKNGIVHRDLKPANVLRTVGGEPKITDFGLAKRLEGDPSQTHSGAIVGTPSYMAPEQAAGKTKEFGPATDIYALGVMLYEMLTGRPPFQAPSALETLEQVRSQDPVSPRRLIAKVPRDLETICLKCLQKEPDKRYPSAESLAEDLRHFLAGEPIRARPTPLSERAVKWMKRNPATAGLIAVSVLGLVGLSAGGVGVAGLEHRRAVEADGLRSAADDERKRADESFGQASSALYAIALAAEGDLRAKSGVQLVRKALLDQNLKYFRQLLGRRQDDPNIQFAVAYSSHLVGVVTSEIGKLDDALAAYDEASALLAHVCDDYIEPMKCRNNLGAIYLYRGLAQRAVGRMEEALQSHECALQIWEKLASEDSKEKAWYQRNLALNYWAIANVHLECGKRAEASFYLQKARKIRQKLHDENPTDKDLLEQLAYNDHSTGVQQLLMRQPVPARGFLERARETRAKLVNADSGNIWLRCDLAKTDLLLGVVHSTLGHRDKAFSSLKEAHSSLDLLVRDNREVTDFQRNLAEAHLQIGKLLNQENRNTEALVNLREARNICHYLRRENPAVTQTLVILAESYTEISRVQRRQGQPDDALQSLREAEQIWKELVGNHPRIPSFQRGQSEVHSEFARLEAEKAPRDSK